jgi:hypothetical protein
LDRCDTEYTTGFFGIDSDGIGFFYAAPEAGLELMFSPSVGFEGVLRYMAASYDDDTVEGYDLEALGIDGGPVLQVKVGLVLGL